MAVQVNDTGDMQVILQAKDEASAVVEKFADNTEKSLDRASKSVEDGQESRLAAFKKEGEEIDGTASKYVKFGGEVAKGATAVAGFAIAVGLAGMKVGDSMQNMADRVGVSAGTLQQFHFAAGLIDLSGQKVTLMLRDMNRYLADTADKGGKAAELLAKMGLSAEELKKADPADAFRQIVSAIEQLPTAAERTQASLVIFKRGGEDALRFAGALREAGNDAKTFGLIMSNEAYQGSDKFYDSIYRVNQQFKGMSTIVADMVAPAFGEMGKIFADAVRDSGALRGAANLLGVVLRGLGAIVTLVAGMFGLLGKLVGGLTAIFAQLAQGNWKGSFEAFKAFKEDITESLSKIGELEGKLLGLQSSSGNMKKMGFTGGGAGFGEGAGDRGTFSDVLPGAQLKTAQNDADFEAERTHYDRMTELHRAWQTALGGIDESELQRRRDLWKSDTAYKFAITESFFSMMAGLMESKSKALFKIGQAFAIADTVMQTYRAAQGAYAAFAWIPLIGPALGIAAAAAAIAVGFARVQAIRSQTVGGSAATPVFNASPTTGLPSVPAANDSSFQQTQAPATQTAPQQQRSLNVTIIGDFISAASMRDQFIPLLNDAYKDGVNVLNLKVVNG